jgi:hypothetical protein
LAFAGNVEMGEPVAKQILESEPENGELVRCCYETLMLPLAMGISVRMFEWQRKEKGVKKQLGHTWIEVNNEVYTFVVDDQDHPHN